MSLKFFLDDVDITAELAKQHPLPDTAADGIYPGRGRNDWFDLLPIIANNQELKNNFFNDDNDLHYLRIVDDSDEETTMRVFLTMKYTARNR